MGEKGRFPISMQTWEMLIKSAQQLPTLHVILYPRKYNKKGGQGRDRGERREGGRWRGSKILRD